MPGRGGGLANNPIQERGEAQVDIVIPQSGKPYLRYIDHAYLNTDTLDPNHPNYKGEVSQDWMRSLSAMIVNVRNNVQGGKAHTGAFKNYPDFIKGDERLEFTVPYDKLPEGVRYVIDQETRKRDLGGGTLSKTTDVTATDAASTAADTQKKKKKTTVAAEMYEPKAEHNEKITKHPKSLFLVS